MPRGCERPTAVEARDLGLTYTVEVGGRPSLRSLLAGKPRPRTTEVRALDGVAVAVPVGSVMGIIGANGAGKSSLLRVVAGILPPTDGEVRVRGSVGTLLSLGATFVPAISGRRNALLGLMATGMSRAEATARLPEVLDFAGIGEAVEWPVQAYSSGMRARLGFAVAATIRPDVLLVDEALAAGDAAFRRRCEVRIREMVAGEATALVVSHRTDAVVDLCDRAVWLDQGTVHAVGDPADVVAQYLAST